MADTPLTIIINSNDIIIRAGRYKSVSRDFLVTIQFCIPGERWSIITLDTNQALALLHKLGSIWEIG
jgi:hypothetical protein